MSNDFVDEQLLNSIGADPAEVMGDQIDAALAQFKDRADALVAAADGRTVTDNDSIGRAADTLSMIRTLEEAVIARGKEVALPHSRAVSVASTRTERFLADLRRAGVDLNQRVADCRSLQRQRAQAQREEQSRREAELRAAEAETEIVSPQIDSSPVALPAVRGDYGSRVGDRAVTTYVYADPRKLPRAVLDAPAVAKAIQTALRAYAKLHPKISGVTANADLTTSHRRPN